MVSALLELLSTPALLIALAVATPLGLVFGCIPGLGGKIAIISLMPLTFSLDLATGCVFLIALHAVVHTGGAVPSILFAIPGTGPSTAIVMDGHAMARRGEASRAISAAAAASGIGGLIGALLLAALIPVALKVMTLVSYPEIFVLSLFSLAVAATLGGKAPARGLVAACFGLALSFVGAAPSDGALRFTGGLYMFWDGIDLIAAVLAIFAIPEMISIAARNGSASNAALAANASGQTFGGLLDTLKHRWLVVRTSLLGAFVGFLPGLGGDAAAWICYAHAARTSKTPEQFGAGAVEGVIGPEAANNAKEGGALAPTLLLGLPGSSGMAVLLVALAPLGIAPGPAFSAGETDILWLMVWALVLSNLLASALLLVITPWLGRVSEIDGKILSPFVILLCLVSVQMSTHDPSFLIFVAVLGMVGYLMKSSNWPRAPFVIGLVMGPIIEDSLLKSVALWGFDFWMRPGALLMIAALLFSALRLRRLLSVEKERPGAR